MFISCENTVTQSNVNITRFYGIDDVIKNQICGWMTLYDVMLVRTAIHACLYSDSLLSISLDFTIGYIGRVC